MTAFCLDNDVDVGIAVALVARGHTATTALAEHLSAADDAQRLLFGTENNRIVIVHNFLDFLLLHRAWLLWRPAGTGYALPNHPGILRIPQQRWPEDEAAQHIDAFLQTRPAITNLLYQWTPSRGWVLRS